MIRRQILTGMFTLLGLSVAAKGKIAEKVCNVCKEPIKENAYRVLRNGSEVHFRHAMDDYNESKQRKKDVLVEQLRAMKK